MNLEQNLPAAGTAKEAGSLVSRCPGVRPLVGLAGELKLFGVNNEVPGRPRDQLRLTKPRMELFPVYRADLRCARLPATAGAVYHVSVYLLAATALRK